MMKIALFSGQFWYFTDSTFLAIKDLFYKKVQIAQKRLVIRQTSTTLVRIGETKQ